MSPKKISKLLLQMPPELRKAADKVADEKGISLTRLINELLADCTGVAIDVSSDDVRDLKIRVEALEKEVFKNKK